MALKKLKATNAKKGKSKKNGGIGHAEAGITEKEVMSSGKPAMFSFQCMGRNGDSRNEYDENHRYG